MKLTPQEQIALAEELQALWLLDMKRKLTDGTINATESATLARVLMHGGWTLDPHTVPQELKDKLTTSVDPTKFEDDDADVLPFSRRA